MVYQASVSPTRSLTVAADPKATLVNYSAPSSRKAGESVTISVTVRNDGGDGYCNVQLEDRETGAVITGYGEVLAAGASFSGALPAVPVMPNKDWLLRLRYGHQEYGEQHWEGSVSFNIVLSVVVAIATALSLALSPTEVAPGAQVTWSGKLTRKDTGAGLGGQPVTLQVGPAWGAVASVTTDSGGNYSAKFTAPAEGIYSYRTYYAGAASVAGALSPQAVLLSGIAVDGWYYVIAAILIGLGLIVASPALIEELKKRGLI